MSNDLETLRARATSLGLKFSGNTGANTLQKKIEDAAVEDSKLEAVLGDAEPLPEIIKQPQPKGPASLAELQLMDPAKIDPKNQILIRQVVRAKALILRRVTIVNLDPADAELSGAVITVMNKYTGKVSKFIPFGEGTENGYHIPQILLNHLQSQKFVLRKQNKGAQFGVKTYKTTMVPKFAVTILPDLTADELKSLADRQAASGLIGGGE